MEKIEEYCVNLECVGSSFAPLLESPWIVFNFRIVLLNDSGTGEKELGTLTALKLNCGVAYRRRMSMFEAFDDFSSETALCYEAVFDLKGRFRTGFGDDENEMFDYLNNDFHILSRIEIDERFKGQGLAGVATRIYLENFANADDVVYLKAFPLQFEAQFADKPYSRSFKESEKRCFEKLCKYYQKLGFRRVGKSNHFLFKVDDFLSRHERG